MKMKDSNNIIYGRNAVKEALKTHRVKSIFMSEKVSDDVLLNLIKKEKIIPKYVTNNELTSLSSGGVHQGVVALIKPYTYYSLSDLDKFIEGVVNPTVVILDGINDTHNMGAILRCLDIFGVSALIVSNHHQVPLNATVAKSSAGAINYVPVIMVSNINQTLLKLKEKGFWIVAADGSASISYHDIKYDFPTALIIGSEGEGISKLVLKNSDYIVKIPEKGHINSLNASVATGILLSEIKK